MTPHGITGPERVNSISALFEWSVSHIGRFSTDEDSPVLICWRLLIHRASADTVPKIKLCLCRKTNRAVPVWNYPLLNFVYVLVFLCSRDTLERQYKINDFIFALSALILNSKLACLYTFFSVPWCLKCLAYILRPCDCI
jgi:hypothetical protein